MGIIGTYTANGGIIRASDGASIPPDPANMDYQAALTAVAAGETIAPYVAPALTQDQLNILAILNNPRRQALLTAALAANDQQILNYVAAQVTSLPTAITYLQNLTLIVLAVIRS